LARSLSSYNVRRKNVAVPALTETINLMAKVREIAHYWGRG